MPVRGLLINLAARFIYQIFVGKINNQVFVVGAEEPHMAYSCQGENMWVVRPTDAKGFYAFLFIIDALVVYKLCPSCTVKHCEKANRIAYLLTLRQQLAAVYKFRLQAMRLKEAVTHRLEVSIFL